MVEIARDDITDGRREGEGVGWDVLEAICSAQLAPLFKRKGADLDARGGFGWSWHLCSG